MANEIISKGGGGMNRFLNFFFGVLIKSDFKQIDYWNRARTITTISKKINLCAIRFNVELSDSQYISYFNQTLMFLEQFAKLRQFQYQTYMNNNTKISIKNTMHMELKN